VASAQILAAEQHTAGKITGAKGHSAHTGRAAVHLRARREQRTARSPVRSAPGPPDTPSDHALNR